MKQILISSVLILVIVLATIGCDWYIVHKCSKLSELLENPDDTTHTEQVEEIWEDFSKLAAYFTGYDLIRTADAAYETYIATYNDDSSSVDTITAREQFRQAIEEVWKIHAFRMERVF